MDKKTVKVAMNVLDMVTDKYPEKVEYVECNSKEVFKNEKNIC